MKRVKALLVSALAAAVMASPAAASRQELSLGAPFSDGMVIQRDKPIPVWGRGNPDSGVDVALGQETKSAVVDAEGRWRVEFAPRAAATGLDLVVTQGENRLDLTDVALGDVLLCSGQSNMVWKMSATALRPEDRRPDVDKKIRLLTVPNASSHIEQDSFSKQTGWTSATENWLEFSSVCLFAGRTIANSEDVTIGLINSAWGGTPIRSWLPFEGLEAAGGMADQLAVLDAFRKDPAAAQAQYGAMLDDLWEARPHPARQRKGKEGYANLFNGMIAPLGSMHLKGAIWYQGENNANNAESTASYRNVLSSMITSWRARFGGELPFVVVQLAGFGPLGEDAGNDDWAAVREAQRLVARDDPGTELVVTIDVSERLDIHPPIKKPVGHRAGAALLALAYGKPEAYRPPQAQSARRVGETIEVEVSHLAGDLFAASWGRPGPFMLCNDAAGEDCFFADASFSDVGIAVVIPAGSTPVLVRYCWDAAPICNVFDQTQMPLGPFELTIE